LAGGGDDWLHNFHTIALHQVSF